MGIDAAIVLVVLAAAVTALVRELASPSAVMIGGLVVVVVLGVLEPEQAFVGFSSPATITIAGLFVVARAIRDHVGLERLLAELLGDGRRGVRPALMRLLPSVALLSSIANNTPVVASAAPVVRGWAERHDVATSRLLMPLSFAAILGGTLTTIGTSTNLVVSGALQAAGRPPLGFFTIAPASLPVAMIGLGLLVVLAPRLLPDRRGPAAIGTEPTGRASHRRLTIFTALGMVGLAATGLLPIVTAVLLACGVLVATNTVSFRRAVGALDTDVLLIVAAAIGLGVAVDSSGLAGALAEAIHRLASGRHVVLGLAVLIAGTVVLTELLTNVATAALVMPIAVDLADSAGAEPTGYAVAVALAASASFLTPIGYQTNTIVYGLGGYRFGDFWRLGLPLTLTVLCVSLLVIPRVWS